LKAGEKQPTMLHNTTSTDVDMFHQLGHLRHNVCNTDVRRSTDRATLTERQLSRELAVNTEPKIMYSKDVGDFDVRQTDERNMSDDVQTSSAWRSYSARTNTLDCGLQTDLFDTQRDVGYVNHRMTHDQDDLIEEQRQEIITFHLPLEERTTEEIYETTITTETRENHQKIEEIRRQLPIDRQQRCSNSPETLVEESYEVVSTIVNPSIEYILDTSTSPHSTRKQRYANLSTSTLPIHDHGSAYSDESSVINGHDQQDESPASTSSSPSSSSLSSSGTSIVDR
jgi:hypothetical protein